MNTRENIGNYVADEQNCCSGNNQVGDVTANTSVPSYTIRSEAYENNDDTQTGNIGLINDLILNSRTFVEECKSIIVHQHMENNGKNMNTDNVPKVGQITNSNNVSEIEKIINCNSVPGVGYITSNSNVAQVPGIHAPGVGNMTNSNVPEHEQITTNITGVEKIPNSNVIGNEQVPISNNNYGIKQITNSNKITRIEDNINVSGIVLIPRSDDGIQEIDRVTNNNYVTRIEQVPNSCNNPGIVHGSSRSCVDGIEQITNSNTTTIEQMPNSSHNLGSGIIPRSNNVQGIKQVVNSNVPGSKQFPNSDIPGMENIPSRSNNVSQIVQIANSMNVPGIGEIPNSNALPRISSIVSGIGQIRNSSVPGIEHISDSSKSVPGIEYLLQHNLRNERTGNVSIEGCTMMESITYQQLESSNKTKVTFTREALQQGRESITMATGITTSTNTNTVTSLVKGLPTASKELPVPRKPVGIRGPIAIREQITTSNNVPGNVPGIEYLLNNDMRNVSMANPLFTRHYEQFQLQHHGDNDKAIGLLSTKEEKTFPPSSSTHGNHNNVVVSRHVETGPSVARKSVGIRETIAFREPISNSNPVPGVEYLFHGGVSTGILTKKMRMPKEDRPFLCQTCGNKFRQQSHLQQHIRIHTNDRPYQCRFCEKAFKQKSQLNQHERIHTGEKPYKCLMCEKAFAQAGQLYSHKKTHGLNMDEIKAQQREVRERTATRKRGRRPKGEDIPSPQVCSPPSVIYIMESHPRAQHHSLSSYLQLPRCSSDVHPQMFNNGLRYQTSKLPKIETVVSLVPPRPRSSVSSINITSPPHYWKNDSPKEPNTDDS